MDGLSSADVESKLSPSNSSQVNNKLSVTAPKGLKSRSSNLPWNVETIFIQKKTKELSSFISSPIQMYRKTYCTTPCVSGGLGISTGGGVSIGKMIKSYMKFFM